MKKNNNSNLHLPNWQQGEHSTLTPLERVELMNEWLKQNKLEILSNLEYTGETEGSVVGFIDL